MQSHVMAALEGRMTPSTAKIIICVKVSIWPVKGHAQYNWYKSNGKQRILVSWNEPFPRDNLSQTLVRWATYNIQGEWFEFAG